MKIAWLTSGRFGKPHMYSVLLCLVAFGCATGSGPVASTSITDRHAVAVDSMTTRTTELHGENAEETDSDEVRSIVEEDEGNQAIPDDFDPLTMDYRIDSGDVLQFQSFDDPELSRQVVVRYDGAISLPLVPDLNLSGRTRDEAISKLTEAYTEVFRDPQLTLTIIDAQSKRYYVMGDVQRPSSFLYDRPVTVLDAINNAGGPRITQRDQMTFIGTQGQLTKAYVIRTMDEYRDVLEFDLRNLTTPGSHQSEELIYPGDIVYIPEGVNLVYLLGEVRSPGVYQLAPGMTLLQLMARAGGHVPATGRINRVVLMREVDPEHTEILLIDYRYILRTGDDILIEPGDIIYVPRRNIVRLQEFVSQYTGTISPVLSLYNQALNSWYAHDRLRTVARGADGTREVVNILQTLQQFGTGLAPLATVTP